MKRFASTLTLATLALGALLAPSAQADFGLNEVDVTFTNANGSMVTQAGVHPFAMTTAFNVNAIPTGKGGEVVEQAPRDVLFSLMRGFAGDPTAVPRCSTADFLTRITAPGGFYAPDCPDATAVGLVGIKLASEAASGFFYSPVYNLEPSPGTAARLGFWTAGVPVPVDVGLSEAPPYNLVAASRSISQIIEVVGARFTLWGVPAAPAHDPYRGLCLGEFAESVGICEANIPEKPFITAPRSCTGPLATGYFADSWLDPGAFLPDGGADPTDPAWVTGQVLTHDASGNPKGFGGCGTLEFAPEIEAKATSHSAESASGLDFSLDFNDEGLANPAGKAQSDLEKAVVTLPRGITVNPSVAEGLGVCTPAELTRETLAAAPGQGCPDASKLGTVEVKTPIVDEAIEGQVYLAQQDDLATPQHGAENPFDSLIAFYIVLRNENLGVLVKIPAKVEPDPVTGQLTTTVEDVPQYPFSSFTFHFREGARAPLITPPSCGTYTTTALLTPTANPSQPQSVSSSFEVSSGPGGGPCPPGGVPPFHPGFAAGATNNNAGSFSPFYMRLTRSDGEQDMTKFSSILPPGELGSLAGVGKCPDAAIETAKAKSGRRELAAPSCPASSEIGRTLAGAGVGEALTYVPGKLYLGGPYHGDPLSVVSVTPAVAGPFDAGTVVVRLALTLNPKTAEVEVDGAASDPIPHILKGIVLKVRDLRVYVDRPNFTLNPTSCDESSAKATLFGSNLNVFDPADDVPVSLSSRYQAANCLNLGFKPKLELKLKGGTKRGGHPVLTATYTPRKGDANLADLVTRLPRSAFLDQAHIRTICTRVQFAAKACPAAAQYGFIEAWTPLLEEPLKGPVYLRSSNHNLPDLVFDLHGLVDVEVATRIDSQKGGIRASVQDAPDAPLSKVVLRMQGAKKGLIVNSRNLCGAVYKANVEYGGHNGKQLSAKPVLRADCGGKRKAKRHHERSGR